MLGLQVYTGSEVDTKRKGTDLMVKYKNHLLYNIDNFYTSSILLLDLLEKGVYCTGTIHTNRKGFSKEIIPMTTTMPQGAYRFASCVDHQLTGTW